MHAYQTHLYALAKQNRTCEYSQNATQQNVAVGAANDVFSRSEDRRVAARATPAAMARIGTPDGHVGESQPLSISAAVSAQAARCSHRLGCISRRLGRLPDAQVKVFTRILDWPQSVDDQPRLE